MRNAIALTVFAALCATIIAPLTAWAQPRGAQCEPGWVPDLFPPFAGLSHNDIRLFTLDVGHGPALYATGSAGRVGGEISGPIKKWDGSKWSRVEGDLTWDTGALEVFDDGSGPTLYVGLKNTESIPSGSTVRKWDGAQWTTVGQQFSEGPAYTYVYNLKSFDDGAGSALYAAGSFTKIGSQSIRYIARWNGVQWSAVGFGLDGAAQVFAVYDDGSGARLYAAGDFVSACGQTVNRVACWNGLCWTPLGSGLNGMVTSMVVYDDGAGPALYVAGDFTTAGGASANRVAKWDGASWSAVGLGVDRLVRDLEVLDVGDGSAPALCAAGEFSSAGGAPCSGVAKWDGQSWSKLGIGISAPPNGFDWASTLAVFDDGSGPELFVAGPFDKAGEWPIQYIAKWDGAEWSPLGDGMDADLVMSPVEALEVFDDGSGPALYVGGRFKTVGGLITNGIAKWNGASWSSLGLGVDGFVYDMAGFDDGSGHALYVGGAFNHAGDLAVRSLARWNGSEWSAVGLGIQGTVSVVCVLDDGSGPALYIGGGVSAAGGAPSRGISKWDGTSWTNLPGQQNGNSVSARSLVMFDDGAGPALYAAGRFLTAGASGPAIGVIRWDGSAWSSVGDLDAGSLRVKALAVFDDGGGSALYAGGDFITPQGPNRLAKWTGAAWVPVGGQPENIVSTLYVFDDGAGAGPALYAGGYFTSIGAVSVSRIAKWNGSVWSTLDSGTTHGVLALTTFDDGSGTGPALFAGGHFAVAGGHSSGGVAKWVACAAAPPSCSGDGNGDNLVNFDDVNATIANWLVNYGAGTGPGDTNGDGSVNFDDISTTIANWLADCGA